jgi:hypothetical protein
VPRSEERGWSERTPGGSTSGWEHIGDEFLRCCPSRRQAGLVSRPTLRLGSFRRGSLRPFESLRINKLRTGKTGSAGCKYVGIRVPMHPILRRCSVVSAWLRPTKLVEYRQGICALLAPCMMGALRLRSPRLRSGRFDFAHRRQAGQASAPSVRQPISETKH